MAGKAGNRRGIPRKTRGKPEEVVPDVYSEMLIETATEAPSRFREDSRATKKRKTSGRVVEHVALDDGSLSQMPEPDSDKNVPKDVPSPARLQTAYDDSEDSAESDVDWEQVDFQPDGEDPGSDVNDGGSDEALSLVLEHDSSTLKRLDGPKRRAITGAERKLRLEIHKMHLLCLLAHVNMRNAWCDDLDVQATLEPLVSKRNISYLNPKAELSQFQRSRSFIDGLEQASEIWKSKYKITARGMRRAYWIDDDKLKNYKISADVDSVLERADFRTLAKRLEGSRDIGAQLFCALLRGVGVEARLVCSLQPLPFQATAAKHSTPQKPVQDIYVVELSEHENTSEEDPGNDIRALAIDSGARIGSSREMPQPLIPRVARRLGTPSSGLSSGHDNGVAPPFDTPRRKRFRESSYPVFWVEAFNKALQKWIPVDPLVTKTTGRPTKFEPPASDPKNYMSYVVAFEEDGVARDVTRRYAKAFNAKTRKRRVEVTKGGETWWRKSLRHFTRGWVLDREQVEESELASREAQEPMPRNVQDFKDHPYYALERHLRRNEIIYPKEEVGNLAAGKLATATGGKSLESIYRRRDVKVLKGADSWYRIGRDIKTGEQPLKRVVRRRARQRSLGGEDGLNSGEDDPAETGLYAEFQTTLYEAPPVVSGKIPKNSYGNLDVYVASMVPRGGVHVPDIEAARAARVLSVDHADAVTGFEFKGRHGTAIVRGIVVAAEYRDALEAVIAGFHDERAQGEAARRSLDALRLWRRFMAALRIKERIDGYEIEGERDVIDEQMEHLKKDLRDEELQDDDAGGFFPDRNQDVIAEPTVRRHMPAATVNGPGDLGDPVDADAEEAIRDVEMSGGAFVADGHCVKDEAADRDDSMADETSRDVADDQSPNGPIQQAGGGFFLGHDESEDDDPASSVLARPRPEQHFEPKIRDHVEQGTFYEDGTGPATETAGTISEGADQVPGAVDYEMVHQADASTSSLLEVGSNQHHTAQVEDGSSSGITDRGSLLSHDPEDEDADPEWLASD